MSLKNRWMSVAVFGLLAAVVARAETIEEIEKAVGEKHGKYNSYSYKMKSNSDMGAMGKSDSTGTVEMSKKDGKPRFRMEMETKSEMSGTKMDSKSLTISDGEYVHTLSENMGQKMAMKQKLTPQYADMFTKNPITMLRENNTVTVGKDETVDGKACWTLEATPKTKTPGFGKIVMCIAKDSGMALKSTTYDDAGKVTSTSVITDFKADPGIGDDRFVFKAPEGVTVMDMDKMQSGGGDGKP